jgi:phospholipid N-methyltransferase
MKLIFFREYVKNIRTVGAILPSSRFLARKIIEGVDFASAQTIVQFGPGTGSFTKEIVDKKRPTTTLLLIEKNTAFYNELKKQYDGKEGVIIVNDSAENLGALLRQYNLPDQVDYIISGLPFASLPRATSIKILKAARNHTKKGSFITFQYSLLKLSFFEDYFSHITIGRELRNIPPAYVLRMVN